MKHRHKLALLLSLTLIAASATGCGRRSPTPTPQPSESPAPSGSPSAPPTITPTTIPTITPTTVPTTTPSGQPTPPPTAKPLVTPQWNQLPAVPVPPKQPANPDPGLPPPDPSTLPNNGGSLPGGGPGTAIGFKTTADNLASRWQRDAYLAQITGSDLNAGGKTQAKTTSYWGFLYYSPSVNQMFSVIANGAGGVTSYGQANPFGQDTPFYLAKLTTWKVDSTVAMSSALANGYKPFTDYASMTLHMLQNAPVWQADGDVSVRVNAATGAFVAKTVQGHW